MSPPRIERPWLSALIEQWERSDALALVVTGSTGAGKTEALRDVVERRNVLFAHFCRARDDRRLNPCALVEDLSARIARMSPAFSAALQREETRISTGDITVNTGPVSGDATVTAVWINGKHLFAREMFDRLVRRPWDSLTPQERPSTPLIVVDALDESLSWRGADTIAALMTAVVAAPPRGMRFLLSTRHLPEVTRGLIDVRQLNLDAHRAEADDDVRRLALRHGAEDPEAVVREAAGNMLVAYYGGGRRLSDIYKDFVYRERCRGESHWRRLLRPVLATMGVLRSQGATAAEIAALLGMTTLEARDALADLGSFVRSDTQGRWTIWHESFRDYVVADQEIGSGPEQDLVLARRMVALFGDDWWACEMPYAATNMVGHLLSAADSNGLGRRNAMELLNDLVADSRWLVKRATLEKSDVLLADVEAAAAVSPAAGAVAGALRRQITQLRRGVEPSRLAQQLALSALATDQRELRESARLLARELEAPYVDSKWAVGPCTGSLRLIIPAHTGTVDRLCISPDHTRALSLCSDEAMRLWDLRTGNLLATVEDVGDADVAWSAGLVVMLDGQGALSTWDLGAGYRRELMPGIVADVVHVDSEGSRLAIQADAEISIRDLRTSRVLVSLPACPVMAVSADRDTVAGLGRDGKLHCGRIDGCTWHADVDTSPYEFSAQIWLSPDGSLLAWTVFTDCSLIEVREVAGLTLLMATRVRPPVHICLDSDKGRMVVTSDDDVMRVFDLAKGRELLSRTVPTGHLHTTMALPTGDVLAASSTGSAYLLPTDPTRHPLHLPAGLGVTALATTSSGEVALCGAVDGNIRLIDLRYPAQDARMGQIATITGFALLPGGNEVWTVDVRDCLRLLNVDDGSVLCARQVSGSPAIHGCDEDTLIVSSGPPGERELLLVDARNGVKLHQWPIGAEHARVAAAWRFDMGWLILVDAGRYTRLLTETGMQWPVSERVRDVRPINGSAVLVISDRGTSIMDVMTGQPIAHYRVCTSILSAFHSQLCAISGDGSTAAVQGDDGLWLLDLRTGRQRLLKRRGHGPRSAGPAVALDHFGTMLVECGRRRTTVYDTADMFPTHWVDYRPGFVHVAISDGPYQQRFCVSSPTGAVSVRSVARDGTGWDCWLDSALGSMAFADPSTIVGLDDTGRLVVLGLAAEMRSPPGLGTGA